MIFEDDEKDNNDFDISIDSHDTDEISWDDLLEVETDSISLNDNSANPIELDNNNEVQDIENENPTLNDSISEAPDNQFVDAKEGLEGITPDNEGQEIIENDLDNFLDLDNLEDQSPNDNGDNSSYLDNNIEQNEDNYAQDTLNNEEINFSDVNSDNYSQEGIVDSSSSEYDISDITGVAVPSDNNDAEISDNEVEILADDSKKSKKTPIIMGAGVAVIVVALIVVALMFGKQFISSGEEQTPSELSALEDVQNQNLNNPPQGQSEDQLLQNLNNQQNPQVGGGNINLENQNKKNEEKVLVNVTKTGRLNPFSPTGNMGMAGYTTPSLPNIAPPGDLNEDKEIGKLVEIVCTGILYDNVKPSAIITVGGIDYFVQKGDRVDKFIVSAITPTSVVIRNGSNAYVASIGQQFDVNDTSGKMKYVYNGKSKPVTRQYLSPSEVEIKVK